MFSAIGTDFTAFVLGLVLSLAASVLLVSRIERLAARLRLPEAVLGLLVALAADSPEIASAVTASLRGQANIGVGVVIGSNSFNIAALLGISSVVAGRIVFHRRVVLFEGIFGLWVVAIAALTILIRLDPRVGLLLVLVVALPYIVVSSVSRDTLSRFRLPPRSVEWLRRAVEEEEEELAPAISPTGPTGPRRFDGLVILASLVVVVSASALMEGAVVSIGNHYRISSLVTGGLILAIVTSLPNAVGAIYLTRKGRGGAVLSETMNSNMLNILAGLLIPASITGSAAATGSNELIVLWYAGLTVLALGLAYVATGLNRRSGAVVIIAYLGFVLIALTRR
jgi:cation:H+ antiporter